MKKTILVLIWLLYFTASCTPTPSTLAPTKPLIIATHSILADIASQVSGDNFQVESVVPDGVDSHSYQPTPKDIARILSADVLIINGFGMEPFLTPILKEIQEKPLIIIATDGMTPRYASSPNDSSANPDPHFWMDPLLVQIYVGNLDAGFSKVAPERSYEFHQNAQVVDRKLTELDTWITAQIENIPPQKRTLITNHETLGYFAVRYGFELAGTVLEGTSSESSASSKHVSELIDLIKRKGVPVIFIEPTDDAKIADEIALETKVKIEKGLLTHSVTLDGTSLGYFGMMRHNIQLILGLAD